MRSFLIDAVTPRMAVDNAVYPITPGLAANVLHVVYDAAAGQGGIEYNDRPPVGIPFIDPSPYQSQFNQWLTAAAADTPPLQLQQAISVKAGLLQAIYNYKRSILNGVTPGPGWATNAATVVPGNRGFTFYNLTAALINPSGAQGISASGPVLNGTKAYWEISANDAQSQGSNNQIGIMLPGASLTNDLTATASGWGYRGDGQRAHNNSSNGYGSSWGNASTGSGDIIGVALDLVHDAIWFSLNGVWQSATSSDIAAGITTGAAYTGLSAASYYPAVTGRSQYNAWTGNFSGPFTYTPPTGFAAIPTIMKSLWDGSDVGYATLLGVAQTTTPQVATTTATNGGTMSGSLSVADATGIYVGSTDFTSFPNSGLPTVIAIAGLNLSIAGPGTLTWGSGDPMTFTPPPYAPSGVPNLPTNEIMPLMTNMTASRNALTTSYNTNLANLNVCANIAAVIAFDITAGWP